MRVPLYLSTSPTPYPVCMCRIYSATFKMEVYLRIAKLFLEEGDHVCAEAYINRAGMLQSDVEQNSLHVIYRVSPFNYN